MEFTKAHGAGNDFVVVPDRDGSIDLSADAVVALCDRRFGIGADGVLRLAPADGAHVFMDYRNGGDGAPVEMCGNGVRVVAAHLVEHGWTDDRELRIETRAGVRTAVVTTDGAGRVVEVDVDMGPPSFGVEAVGARAPTALGVTRTDRDGTGGGPDATGGSVTRDGVAVSGLRLHEARGELVVDIDGDDVRLLPVSMGNPHVVLIVPDPATAPVTTLGPVIERSPVFAAGTNVEFVSVRDRDRIELRVWERGVGETLACGTGVCGAVAALTRDGALDAGVDVTVAVPGGTLRVRWAGGADDPVHLVGPAVEIATVTPSPALLRELGLERPVDG